MSAVNWTNEIARIVRSIAYGLAGWILIAPIAILVPKKRGQIAVIGRFDGEFADNSKYFFIQCREQLPDPNLVQYITERVDVSQNLAHLGIPHQIYPSFAGAIYLLRSSVVVVDSNEWQLKFRRFVAFRSRIVQLWHGVGFKRIQSNKRSNEAHNRAWLSKPAILRFRNLLRYISGKHINYDLLVTTSEFYLEHVFRPSFRSKHFLIAGYPRNTFGIGQRNVDAVLTGVDKIAYEKCILWRSSGRKIVLVTPTFRDTRSTQLELDEKVVREIDRVCELHKIEFMFKFHPYERNPKLPNGRHIHIIKSDSDLYPIIPLSNALVTDYSSIYTDYSLIGKPIVFFTSDIEEYQEKDRQFQFDYDQMTPGPKVHDWNGVIEKIIEAFSEDTYKQQREATLKLAFDSLSQTEATSRVLCFLHEKDWL